MHRIFIVGENAWGDVADSAFRSLEPRQSELARALLLYMHDLHVGLTPELAAGLAGMLTTDPRRREGWGPWARIYEHLTDALAGDEEGPGPARREGRSRHAGLVPEAAPYYWAARFAAPLAAQACQALGQTYLFAAGPLPPPENFERRYKRYADYFAKSLARLEPSLVFRADRVLTLSHLSRRGGVSPGLPEVDHLALAQMLRLRTELSEHRSLPRSLPRRLSLSLRHRPLLNRNEGGVDGIQSTRRMADLQDILKSELLQPREVLLDRLLQSGYLALRRPPLRERQRDVLVVGLLPQPPTSPAAMRDALIKASWFEAMMRLALWILRAGLRRSEFLWIEADASNRQRESRALLEPLASEREALPEAPHAAFRQRFLTALGWLPDYLDRHAPGRWPALPDGSKSLVQWAAAAWRGQRDHPHWGPEKGRTASRPLEMEAYDTVHLMLFLPGEEEVRREAQPGALRSAFDLPPAAGYSLSVTWIPAVLDPRNSWGFSSGRRAERSLKVDDDDSPDFENRLAGKLLDCWLETILKELLRDR